MVKSQSQGPTGGGTSWWCPKIMNHYSIPKDRFAKRESFKRKTRKPVIETPFHKQFQLIMKTEGHREVDHS